MKKFTQADFDSFERDEHGYKICPTGDYTSIRDFGKYCSFGNGCIFGECCIFGEDCGFGWWCSFGERCRFNKQCGFEGGDVKNGKYVAIDRIGSEDRKIYFFIDENETVYVRVGCWFSGLDEFKERVREVHAGTIYEKTYLVACDLAELMLKEYE